MCITFDDLCDELVEHIVRAGDGVMVPVWSFVCRRTAGIVSGLLRQRRRQRKGEQPVVWLHRCEAYAVALAGGGHTSLLTWAVERGLALSGDRESLDRIAAAAARGGHVGVLRWMRDNHHRVKVGVVLAEAARAVRTEVIEWAHDVLMGQRLVPRKRSMVYVCAGFAYAGRADMIQWARDRGWPWDETACASAASAGHVAVLRWLRGRDCPWDRAVYVCAAEGSHIGVLEWARANGCPTRGDVDATLWGLTWLCDGRDFRSVFDTEWARAAASGSMETLEWLHKAGFVLSDEQACSMAAYHGRLDVLRWLHERGCPWTARTPAYAAAGGHLDVLEWTRANGYRWDGETCVAAARGGHLEVLKWARARGCPWGVWSCACMRAAEHGHAAAAQWARAEGCPWGAQKMCEALAQHGCLDALQRAMADADIAVDAQRVGNAAAARGRIDTLCWLEHRGIKFDETTCAKAARGGHIDVIAWLRERGCPWDETACASAASAGHVDALRWLRAHGCPWDARVCASAASKGQVEVLAWARAEGCPWNKGVCKNAAALGALGPLRWARAHGCPWDPKRCLAVARTSGNPRIVAYIKRALASQRRRQRLCHRDD